MMIDPMNHPTTSTTQPPVTETIHGQCLLFGTDPGAETPAQTPAQALNVGVPLLVKNPSTGKFKLTMGVQKSNNLSTPFTAFPMNTVGTNTTINAAGKLEFEFTSPDNAAFFRIESK